MLDSPKRVADDEEADVDLVGVLEDLVRLELDCLAGGSNNGSTVKLLL